MQFIKPKDWMSVFDYDSDVIDCLGIPYHTKFSFLKEIKFDFDRDKICTPYHAPMCLMHANMYTTILLGTYHQYTHWKKYLMFTKTYLLNS